MVEVNSDDDEEEGGEEEEEEEQGGDAEVEVEIETVTYISLMQ